MKCLSLQSTDIAQDHRWHWTYLCKNKYRGEKLILLRAKIWFKIDPCIENVKTLSSFMHALKKNISLHLQS